MKFSNSNSQLNNKIQVDTRDKIVELEETSIITITAVGIITTRAITIIIISITAAIITNHIRSSINRTHLNYDHG